MAIANAIPKMGQKDNEILCEQESFPGGTMSTLQAVSNQLPTRQNREMLLEIDDKIFREKFNRVPFLIHHNLSDHPLFGLKRLVELSRRLDAQSVKYNDGNLTVAANLEEAPGNGLSVEETMRRIEDHCSWMVLKNIQSDPAYGELLHQCLEEIKVHSEPIDPGMCDPRAFVFISSPNAVTPFHIDPEINFLLQIRGSKTMSIFDPLDREILPEQNLEQFSLAEDLSIVKYRDEFQSRAFVAELSPGIGVHCPVTAPHWVKNGPAVSISFSITFRSISTHRRHDVYWMNAHLRRWGISPTPVGSIRWKDDLKFSLFRTMAATKNLFGR